MTPIEEIAAERERQKAVEGWTAEHDDEHADGSLSRAAAVYAMPHGIRQFHISRVAGTVLDLVWPVDWGREWFKPKDRRRDLVRAGALIVAEIERLDRAAQQKAA